MNPFKLLPFKSPRLAALIVAGVCLSLAGLSTTLSNTPAQSHLEINDTEIATAYSNNTPYYPFVSAQTLSLQNSYDIERTYSGTVKAKQHAQVSFELSGKIALVMADVGDRVDKGQKLAQLDTTNLRIEKRLLQAKVAEVDANIELLQANLQRQSALKGSGYSSQQQLDELLAKQKTLQAAKRQLNVSIELTDSHIERSTLLSPFAGSITERFVDRGHVINAGQSVLRVQQQAQMEVNIGVPMNVTEKLQPGQSYPVRINNKHYAAKLINISTDVQPLTRSILLRMLLPSEAQVFNGDLAELTVTESIQQNGFWVPASAITDGVRGLWSIYILKDANASPATTGANYVLEKRDVNIHHAQSQRYFVSGLLETGELAVSNGLQKLVPGQTVRILQPTLNADNISL